MGHGYGRAQVGQAREVSRGWDERTREGGIKEERRAGYPASWLFRARTASGEVFLLEPALLCLTPAWYSGPLPGQTSRPSGLALTFCYFSHKDGHDVGVGQGFIYIFSSLAVGEVLFLPTSLQHQWDCLGVGPGRPDFPPQGSQGQGPT